MSRLEDVALASGVVPDAVLRRAIRARVKNVVAGFERLSPAEQAQRQAAVVAAFESGPITICADDANRQHYELPPDFFRLILGPRLKYSSCYWPAGVDDLAGAEEAMLALTAERAGLADGQNILDLGCGWGSLALWAAEHFPHSRVTAVSNSHSQRRDIEQRATQQSFSNLEVITAEVSTFKPEGRFDRIVSVEMFEHVRNHGVLLARVADWLQPEGRLFVHVFCHREHVYAFEAAEAGAWMARHFFSGGMMPSWDHLLRYQDHLRLVDRWQVEGNHYARTLRSWLKNLDGARAAAMPLLEATYGREHARLWLVYWRIFFMACEETFSLGGGRQYFVGHYLFHRA